MPTNKFFIEDPKGKRVHNMEFDTPDELSDYSRNNGLTWDGVDYTVKDTDGKGECSLKTFNHITQIDELPVNVDMSYFGGED